MAMSGVVSAVFAVVVGLLAIHATFSRDAIYGSLKLEAMNTSLLQQQMGLTRERDTLAGANADLRQTRQRLTAETAAIGAKLDQSRERQRALLASTRSLKADLAAQLLALNGQRRAVAALRTNRDALKGQTDALVSTLDDTAETVVRATVGSRLASYSPKFADLQTASYTYLLAPDAITASAGAATVRAFKTYSLDDLNEDDRSASCPITSGIVLVGFEMTMSDVDASARLVDKSDPIMKRLCVVLPAQTTVFNPRTRKSWRVSIYDILRRGDDETLLLKFLPGEFNGLSYEELQGRGFWFPASGNLYAAKYWSGIKPGDIKTGTGTAPTISVQWGDAYTRLEKSLEDPKLAPVLRAFRRLDDAWMSYLAATPMDFPSDDKPTPLLVGGKFRRVLPRLTTAQLTTADFMQAREAVGQFNYQLYCSAATFSQTQHFVMTGADPEIDNCEAVNGWQTLARDAVSRMPKK